MEQSLFTSIPIDEFKELIQGCVKSELANLRTEPQPEDEFITSKQAIKILGVSLVTLAKWRKEGKVPYHKISSRIRFLKSEVKASIKPPKQYGRGNDAK